MDIKEEGEKENDCIYRDGDYVNPVANPAFTTLRNEINQILIHPFGIFVGSRKKFIYTDCRCNSDLWMTEKKTRFDFRIPIFVAVLMIPILFMGINKSYSEGTFVYVSNGEDGHIAVMKLNPETGDMKMVEKVPAGPNVKHMALSPDHRFLYASVRSEPFSVITYLINSETGNLTQLSKESLPDNMVYISVDQTGRFLLSVSNNDKCKNCCESNRPQWVCSIRTCSGNFYRSQSPFNSS